MRTASVIGITGQDGARALNPLFNGWSYHSNVGNGLGIQGQCTGGIHLQRVQIVRTRRPEWVNQHPGASVSR